MPSLDSLGELYLVLRGLFLDELSPLANDEEGLAELSRGELIVEFSRSHCSILRKAGLVFLGVGC